MLIWAHKTFLWKQFVFFGEHYKNVIIFVDMYWILIMIYYIESQINIFINYLGTYIYNHSELVPGYSYIIIAIYPLEVIYQLIWLQLHNSLVCWMISVGFALVDLVDLFDLHWDSWQKKKLKTSTSWMYQQWQILSHHYWMGQRKLANGKNLRIKPIFALDYFPLESEWWIKRKNYGSLWPHWLVFLYFCINLKNAWKDI